MRNRNSHHPTKDLEALGNCQALQCNISNGFPEKCLKSQAARKPHKYGAVWARKPTRLPRATFEGTVSPPSAGPPQTPEGSFRQV